MESVPLISQESVARGAAWLAGTGRDSDVVISSRIRLARNLAGRPFPARSTLLQRAQVVALCRDHLMSGVLDAPGRRMVWADIHAMSPLGRSLLVERHLMSKEHAKGKTITLPVGAPAGGTPTGPEQTIQEPRGLAVTLPDESLSIMVNEEDHLRIQVLLSGLALSEAWKQIDDADDQVEGLGNRRVSGGSDVATADTPPSAAPPAPAADRGLIYAFSPRFGYLTTCPTNVGCGVRMSVMLHLPGLRLTGEIDKVKNATKDMNLALRGFYGEGSESTGDLYQVSNQGAFGKPEREILREIETEIVPEIVRYERDARTTMLERRRRILEDQVFRALGLLRNARMLTPEEALAGLSMVRLGILCGLVPIPEQVVSQLFLLTQPAHLQRLLGVDMDQQRRRAARADLVRERLGA